MFEQVAIEPDGSYVNVINYVISRAPAGQPVEHGGDHYCGAAKVQYLG